MATAADPNTTQASEQYTLARTAQSLFVGLVWAAAMLGVFGLWMRSKYEGRAPTANVFFIASAAAALLAGWQAFTLWFQKTTPAEKSENLKKQGQLFSYVFLAGGLGLIILAFALGFDKRGASGSYSFKPDNFAETFGVLIFGIIGLAFGYYLQQPAGTQTSPIQYLVGNTHTLKLFLIVLAGACIVGFGTIFYKHRDNFTVWFPELVGLLLMSILCVGCVLWLNTGQFDETGMRVLVIVFGGTTGVIVFFMTLWRAYLWRQDIILGGAAAWQGEHAWHFWICAYILFASLVLMFLSFNLARADIRKDVVLRRVMYGYDAIVQGLLLIGIMTILNIVVYALVPFSFDWTKTRGVYALADASKALLANLKQDTTILVVMPKTSPAQAHVRSMLDNCQAIAGSRLKVEYLSPDINQVDFQNLVLLFPQIIGDPTARDAMQGVLIVYGEMPKKAAHNVPHAWVPQKKLVEQDPPMRGNDKPKITFKGEESILRELKFLAEGRTKRKIYVLQGNDEPSINSDERDRRGPFNKGFAKMGLGLFVDRLKADNLEVTGLSFAKEKPGDEKDIVHVKEDPKDNKKHIPNDCHTLIIVGPSKTFSPEMKDAIENYMDHRNGHLLVFLDAVTDANYTKMQNTGLEALLQRYGVEVTDEYILRLPERPRDDPFLALASTPGRSDNALARGFAERSIVVRQSARVVKPKEGTRYKGETILQLEPEKGALLVEKDVGRLEIEKLIAYLNEQIRELNMNKPVKTMVKEAVSVGVAVTDNENKKRLVVFGDTELICNLELSVSQTKNTNYSMALSSLEWMAEREELVGVVAHEKRWVSLDPNVDYWRMVLLPLWLMGMLFVAVGVGFWLVRRR